MVKNIVFFLGCILAWFIVLPILTIFGLIALVGYATVSQLANAARGRAAKTPDASTAREIARQVCLDR
jgi:uncharacterized membrane protein